MKLLKTSKEIGNEIYRCIEEYSNISFAVAWIKNNKIYQKLLKNKDKIQFSTVGIDFAGTDVNVLKDFQNSNKVKIYKWEYTFHPKIYVFYNRTKYKAIIGSANLTEGGMYNNDECAVLFTESDGVLLDNVLEKLEDYFDKAKIITDGIIETYSKEYEAIKENNNSIVKRLEPTKQKIDEAPYIDLKWGEVSEIIQQIDFVDRSGMLNDIQEIFKKLDDSNIKFENLELDERRMIIGNSKDVNNKYRAFGGLASGGKAQQILLNQDDTKNTELRSIIEELDKIELLNEDNMCHPVSETIVRNIVKTVMGIEGCGISTVTRLLAVKRPDLFLCVNDGNQNSIKELFGFRISGKYEIDKYIKLLKMIYNTDYFNHKLTKEEKQDEALVTISKYRVALLDSYLLQDEYE